ncbi:hypothetical protein H2200_010698 [Cladophialophora chaetospira]|uniref:Uncharacterized protein n=1 Tax=Cladophialophora chaetospira TaxID=386627 RepID=A0AA38X0N0_9EURO|nr:hypothetical protein H2200_010698 [Cladophialophora chaetospira]
MPADVSRFQNRQSQDGCMVYTFHQKDIRPTDSLCFYRTLQSLADMPEQDYIAYDFCRRNTMQDLATHHLTHFWTQTVVSASHQEPAVLHALLALSGAHRTYIDNINQPAIPQETAKHLTMPSYIHYGKAVHYLQNRIPGSEMRQDELEVILIVCLLLLTFDIIEGRYNEALVHLNHGRRILKGLQRSIDNQSLSDQSAVTLYLPQKVQSTLDDLSYSFALMDLQSITFGSDILQFKLAETLDADNMQYPTAAQHQFSTFDDAWRSLLILENEIFHFTTAVKQQGGLDQATIIWQSKLLTSLRGWKSAFDNSPLRRTRVRTPPTGVAPEHDPSSTLRLNHSYLTIVVGIALSFGDEMASDSFLPQFVTIVALCEDLVTRLPTISLDASLIPALYATATICRHPNVRRRALQTLLKSGREGHWDGKQVAMIATQKMLLEEEMAGYAYCDGRPVPETPEVVAETIPREARWEETWADFVDDEYTKVLLTFKRRKCDQKEVPWVGGSVNEEDKYEVRRKLVDLTQPRGP